MSTTDLDRHELTAARAHGAGADIDGPDPAALRDDYAWPNVSGAIRYRLHADVPEPADPWAGPNIPHCWRCMEPYEPDSGCPHGTGFCAECADRLCGECEYERAEAIQEQRDDYARENG